jgi:hypothetical protein
MKPEDRFAESAKRLLDQDAAAMDKAAAARLRRARLSALGRETTDAGSRLLRWRLPAALATAAAVLAIVVALSLRPSPPSLATGPVEDLELLAESDSLEFYEDLDFYAWLAEGRPDEG